MAVFAHTLKGIDGRPWCQPWRAYIEVKRRRSCSRFWVPSFVGRKGPPSPCLVYDMHGVYKSTHCLVYDLGCQILYCLSTTTLLIVIMLRIKTLASNRRGVGSAGKPVKVVEVQRLLGKAAAWVEGDGGCV